MKKDFIEDIDNILNSSVSEKSNLILNLKSNSGSNSGSKKKYYPNKKLGRCTYGVHNFLFKLDFKPVNFDSIIKRYNSEEIFLEEKEGMETICKFIQNDFNPFYNWIIIMKEFGKIFRTDK